jgi:hypothetical protein
VKGTSGKGSLKQPILEALTRRKRALSIVDLTDIKVNTQVKGNLEL